MVKQKELVIVSQDNWRVKEPHWRGPLRGIAKYIFFSVTDTAYCMLKNSCCKRIRSLQTKQLAKAKIPDLRYNFLVGGDGNVYEGRGWNVRPSLPRKYLDYQGDSLFIAFIGEFIDEKPSQKMYDARHHLLQYAVQHEYLKPKFLQFNV